MARTLAVLKHVLTLQVSGLLRAISSSNKLNVVAISIYVPCVLRAVTSPRDSSALYTELMDRLDCDLGQAVSLGTTIMAASFDGGVVLGADSRTSTGNYIANRVTDKLTPLAENIYVCRSGSAADTQNLSSYVQYFLAQHRLELDQDVGVKTAAQLAKNMVYQNKEMLQAGLIVAGWDKEEGGGSVYAVPLGGTLVKCPFAIGGSGSAYIYGLCDRHWKAGMSEEECKAFVQKAVSHAMARDGSSGGCIRTVSISKQGVKRDFVPGHSVPGHYGELPRPQPQRVAAS